MLIQHSLIKTHNSFIHCDVQQPIMQAKSNNISTHQSLFEVYSQPSFISYPNFMS